MHKAFDQGFLRAFNKNLREATDQAARNASALKRPRRAQANDYVHVDRDDEDSAATNKYLQQRERRRSRGRKILEPTLKGYTPLPIRALQEATQKKQALQMDLKARVDRAVKLAKVAAEQRSTK